MTVRQYLDSDSIKNITGVVLTDDRIIDVAEADIDSYVDSIMNHMYAGNIKSFGTVIEAEQAEFNGQQLTLPNQVFERNYFQFTVVELLEKSGGYKRGQRFPVVSSDNNVLTLSESVDSFTAPVKIQQIGLFPRRIDEGQYGKSIPYQLIEAVAWQAAHYQNLGSNAQEAVGVNTEKTSLKSESIGTSYSYTKLDRTNIADVICVKSKTLIDTLI
jgi:hypothetical protein